MVEVKTFERAKELTLKKWEDILEELNEIEVTIGDQCGFCLLADYEVEQITVGYKCTHCIVENKCEEYKDEMKYLNRFQEWVDKLLDWLDDLKEENTTSRYLENKGGE